MMATPPAQCWSASVIWSFCSTSAWMASLAKGCLTPCKHSSRAIIGWWSSPLGTTPRLDAAGGRRARCKLYCISQLLSTTCRLAFPGAYREWLAGI